jgi:pectate lyase
MSRSQASQIAAVFAATVTILSFVPRIDALDAFPGAEGAGKNAVGGRGGDVYFVTNLNDSGAGSLRYGVDTASGPRTILFDVAGTIHLQSALKSKKSFITFAGQSAPGGGITIADQEFGISECNDVILQYVRVRLGDDPASRALNPAPDALNVGTVHDVMIDHATASWSIDEALPVTHGSTNVTVQYSMISEALKNAGHPSGSHSFAVGVDAGNMTYAHNLFADDDSRNPRVGDLAQMDFVNNVIFNSGSNYGYSSGTEDTPSINYVANFGVDGPNTSSSSALYSAQFSSHPSIFFQGNLRDNSTTKGVLDETVATGTKLMNTTGGGAITLLSQRVNLPQVTTTDARTAYINVLSHAGATQYRDAADRRIVRGVLNQFGAIIDSPSQVGGYPVLPAGTKPSDANSDGVADWFAALHGYSVAANAPKINNVALPSGYTMLESYLQTLTPNAYAPTQTQSITVSSGFRRGGDAYVTENGGGPGTATSGGNGAGSSLDAIWGGTSGATNQAIVLKYDLSQIVPGSITDAHLQLTASSDFGGSRQFKVFALEQDAPGWDWNESSIQFNGAPGMTFDQNSRTLGLDSTSTNIPNILTMGTLTVGAMTAGTTVDFNNANLAVFLNLSQYFQNTAERGLVTLILEPTSSSTVASFYSREGSVAQVGDETLAPRLVLQATAASMLTGDVNGDGYVDKLDVDYVVAHWGGTDSLADLNGDNVVDALDIGVISQHWTYPEPLQAAGVPEPTSFALACFAGMMIGFRRCRWLA